MTISAGIAAQMANMWLRAKRTGEKAPPALSEAGRALLARARLERWLDQQISPFARQHAMKMRKRRSLPS